MSHVFAQRTIEEVAAAWDVRLRSHRCSPDDRHQFDAWLLEDPRHQAAYARLQGGLATLRAARQHPQLRALTELASLAEHKAARSGLMRWAVAASAALVIATMVVGWWRHSPEQQFASRGSIAAAPHEDSRIEVLVTGVAERRTVSLADGSSVTLNGSTRIEYELLAHERRIRLLSGQALFRVAHDKTRPFIVTAGDRTVTALGTAFDVRLNANGVQVTLLEGRVAVRGVGTAANQAVLELQPRQQLVAAEGEVPTVRVVDPIRSSAWAEGQVFFTDEALPAAVAQMNEYSTQPIVVGDAALARYRVNGMFMAGNQDGFVSALTAYFPIEAVQDREGRIILRARSHSAPAP